MAPPESEFAALYAQARAGCPEATGVLFARYAGHVRAATSSNYGPMGSIVFVTDMGMWWSDDRGVTFHGPETPACDGRRFASDGPSGVGVTIVTGGD